MRSSMSFPGRIWFQVWMYVRMYVCMYAGSDSCYTPEVIPYSRNIYVCMYAFNFSITYVLILPHIYIRTYIHICTYLGLCYQVGNNEHMMCRSLVCPRGDRWRRCHREAIHQELKFDSAPASPIGFTSSRGPSSSTLLFPSFLTTHAHFHRHHFLNQATKTPKKREKTRCDQFLFYKLKALLRTYMSE